ncbi:MAG TPA: outer membrane lipoprotein carrier protein LolA [Jatrophihabitantaceae bacterium]|nr:outer membrane lipoprotein carrier protein LolA [Jatrophihabitantaceae bacterium]
MLLLLLALQNLQDPGPALDRASATYQTIRTLSAEFTQIITNPMIGAPDTTRGKLYQMRPSRFAMRFTHPRGDRIVADGRHLWLYTPSTTPGQVIRTTIPAASTSGGPNFIGQFVERPRERYRARYVRSDSVAGRVTDVVELVPKTDDLPYSKAVVWIDREDGLVRRVEIEETSWQHRTLVLAKLAVNRGVPGREFIFSPPAGLRVVDQ